MGVFGFHTLKLSFVCISTPPLGLSNHRPPSMESPFTASSRLPQSCIAGVWHGVGSDFQVSKPPGAMNGGEFCPSMKTTLHRLYMCVCTYICLSGIKKGKESSEREREREREREKLKLGLNYTFVKWSHFWVLFLKFLIIKWRCFGLKKKEN